MIKQDDHLRSLGISILERVVTEILERHELDAEIHSGMVDFIVDTQSSTHIAVIMEKKIHQGCAGRRWIGHDFLFTSMGLVWDTGRNKPRKGRLLTTIAIS